MEMMIASPGGKSEEEMARLKARQAAVAQHAPLAQREKGMGEQVGDMYKQKAMNAAVNESSKMAMDGAKPYMQKITNAINPMGSAGAGTVAGQATTNAALASTPATMGMAGAELGALASTAAPVATGVGTGVATGVGAGAGMAALGTAVPYIGAAMLAGKALGFFNEGGKVVPLSPEYKMSGGPLSMGVLSMYQDMMKKNMR